MTEQTAIIQALGRIEGKMEVMISTVRQQGNDLLELQKKKLDIEEKDKILADSNEAKKVIHERIEKQGGRIALLEKIGYGAIAVIVTIQALISASLIKL